MKILISMLLFISMVFSLEIHKNTTLEEQTQTDHFSITLNISQSDTRKGNIELNFERLIDIARESEICSGGGYNIYPRYDYHSKKENLSTIWEISL